MKSLELQPNRKLQAVRLSISVGLATLFLMALLWGPRGLTTAHADPDILYVDGVTGQDSGTCGTTTTPCKTISYVLDNRASTGDTIRMAQGVYIENLGINLTGVTLEGGYEHSNWTRNITLYETIIDGSGATFMRPVIDFFAGSGGATLDGFTVQNGDAYWHGGGISIADGADDVAVRNCTIISNTAREVGGGGISSIGNTNSTITGCTIMNNIAEMGGGLYIGEALSVTVGNNLIMSNSAISGEAGLGRGGGIFASDGSKGKIVGNEIISNTATGSERSCGGGIYLASVDTEFTVKDNLVQNNRAHYAGGIRISGDARASILHNTIVSNTVEEFAGGLRIDWNSEALVDRNMIAHNQANDSAGISVWNTTQPITFTNNIIVHNGSDGVSFDETFGASLQNNTIAFNAAGGVRIMDSTVGLRNNIVVSNMNCGINLVGGTVGTVTLDYNDFWGNTPQDYCDYSAGIGDISAAPEFVNAAADDFHLLSDSPCVDAGTNVGAPTTDFDNDLRPLDGDLDGVAITDIGADECMPYRIYLPLTLKNSGW